MVRLGISKRAGQLEHCINRFRICLSVQLFPGFQKKPGLLNLLRRFAVHCVPTLPAPFVSADTLGVDHRLLRLRP